MNLSVLRSVVLMVCQSRTSHGLSVYEPVNQSPSICQSDCLSSVEFVSLSVYPSNGLKKKVCRSIDLLSTRLLEFGSINLSISYDIEIIDLKISMR